MHSNLLNKSLREWAKKKFAGMLLPSKPVKIEETRNMFCHTTHLLIDTLANHHHHLMLQKRDKKQ
jgi:hypothetical protein